MGGGGGNGQETDALTLILKQNLRQSGCQRGGLELVLMRLTRWSL